MLEATGERQIGKTLDQIKPDHLKRYEFAADWISTRFAAPLVLDGACGTGYGSFVIAESGAHVIAVDIEQDALDHGEKHFQHDSVIHSQFDLMSDVWPFTDKEFDCCVSFETIEHVKEPEKYLKNVAQHSHYLIASVPNEVVIPYNGYAFPFHERHYTPEEFIDLIERSGFSVKKMYAQQDKHIGNVFAGDAGRTLIIVAHSNLA